MDAQKLLEQFLGSNALGNLGGQAQRMKDQVLGGQGSGAGLGGNLGALLGGQGAGLAAGGLLGVLLGSKSVRKMAGGMAAYGGAAALGALAFRAFQNWQAGQQAPAAPTATQADVPREGSPFLPRTASDGRPFALALLQSMIAAANSDGHIGPEEHKQIFEAVNRAGLDAEAKAFIFDALANPPTPLQIAAMANGPEQAAELYLAARLAIDPDLPTEKAFLQSLSQALNLQAGLVAHLEAQVAGA